MQPVVFSKTSETY